MTVTCEDVNLRVWSREASWGKAVLVVAIQSAHCSLGTFLFGHPTAQGEVKPAFACLWLVFSGVNGQATVGKGVNSVSCAILCLTTAMCKAMQGMKGVAA